MFFESLENFSHNNIAIQSNSSVVFFPRLVLCQILLMLCRWLEFDHSTIHLLDSVFGLGHSFDLCNFHLHIINSNWWLTLSTFDNLNFKNQNENAFKLTRPSIDNFPDLASASSSKCDLSSAKTAIV